MTTPQGKNGKRKAVRQFGMRRRRDGGPAAGQPAPVDPKNDDGLSGGAAAALSFEE